MKGLWLTDALYTECIAITQTCRKRKIFSSPRVSRTVNHISKEKKEYLSTYYSNLIPLSFYSLLLDQHLTEQKIAKSYIPQMDIHVHHLLFQCLLDV